MISVYVAAPSAVVRAGLEAVICSNGALSMAGSGSTDHLLASPDEPSADVLLVSLGQITEEWISSLGSYPVPAVVLAELPEAPLLAAALRGNVRAVLSPEASADEIVAAVKSAMVGLVALQPAAIDLLLQNARPSADALDDPLTPRELEVLAMLAEGLSNKIIAHRLSISEHTVKFHVTAILGKLQAGSRTDAVMQGIRRGLVMI